VRNLELLDRQHGAAHGLGGFASGASRGRLAVLERRRVIPECHRHRATVLLVDEDEAAREPGEPFDLRRRLAEDPHRVVDPFCLNFVACNACQHGPNPTALTRPPRPCEVPDGRED
jgi:hypothetical protein